MRCPSENTCSAMAISFVALLISAQLTKTDDFAPPATEVLVFMIVSLNSHWKVPCAYFVLAGLSEVERANLLT
jgi:hypothetical protein